MSYPNAYCVKCGKQTESLDKHTIVMQNGSRAVTGVCADCTSQVYKIVPKNQDFKEKEASAAYPDAFCLKCRAHMPTQNARTVILDNQSRAVTGNCEKCGNEVFRILPPRRNPAASATLRLVPSHRQGTTTMKISPQGMASSQAMLARSERLVNAANRMDQRLQSRRRSESMSVSMAKSLWLGGTMIALIVSAFLAYSLML